MRLLTVFALVAVIDRPAPAAPAPINAPGPDLFEPRPVWKFRLQLPVVSGVNHLFRDAPPPFARVTVITASREVVVLGAYLGAEWPNGWLGELHVATTFENSLGRTVLGGAAGRSLTLWNRRDLNGRGGVTALTPLAGLAYRSRANEWIRGGANNGQFSVAITATLPIEYTYYTSPRSGWTFRLRIDSALVVHQAGPPVWTTSEGASFADGYRAHVGAGFDLGRVF